MSEGSKDFVAGFFIGGLIGAAVALALAPMPGADVRRRVGERAGEWTDEARAKAEELAGTARERVGEVTATLRDRAGEVTHQAMERVDDLRSRMNAAVEAGREAAQEKHEELAQRVEESGTPIVPPESENA